MTFEYKTIREARHILKTLITSLENRMQVSFIHSLDSDSDDGVPKWKIAIL